MLHDIIQLYTGPLASIAWSVFFIALMAGSLSPLIVVNRMAFFSDSIAHATLLGIAIGFIAQEHNLVEGLHPLVAMSGMALLTGLFVSVLRAQRLQSIDTLLGVVMAGAMALGVLLYQANRGTTELHAYLFGDPSLLPKSWLLPTIFISIGIFLFVLGLFNRMVTFALDNDLLATRGWKRWIFESCFIVMLAFAVALGVRAVGIILINALLIVPGACSRNLFNRLSSFFWGSVVIAGLSAFLGLSFNISFKSGQLAPGPTIVVVSTAFFVLSLFAPLLRKISLKYKKRDSREPISGAGEV